MDRNRFERLWVEYYDRRAKGIEAAIRESQIEGRHPAVDKWIGLGMPHDLYYHKHLAEKPAVKELRLTERSEAFNEDLWERAVWDRDFSVGRFRKRAWRRSRSVKWPYENSFLGW